MANLTCTQMLKVCHLRLLRLSSAGAISVGVSSRYEHKAPVLFGYSEVRPDAEHLEQPDGCGDICASFDGPQKAVSSLTLRLQLCEENAEVDELLLGGALISEGTGPGNTIGYIAATDATVNANGVALETWAWQWNGKQRALKGALPGWYRHVFPKTFWTKDEVVQENGFAAPAYTGTAVVNSAFSTGYTGDANPVAVGDAPYLWYVDDAVPAANCGYLAVA